MNTSRLVTIRAWRWLVLSLASCCLANADDSAPLKRVITRSIEVELRLQPTPHFVVSGLVVSGLDATSAELSAEYFFVSVKAADQASVPPLLGEYRVSEDRLAVFTPRYPLSQNVDYRFHFGPKVLAVLSNGSNERALSDLPFRLPDAPARAKATVTRIFPSADRLPENLLKFYINFSSPMSRGQAYQHIHLFELSDSQAPTEIHKPFLELGEELWDSQQTRFTLFIHPGRIKRGLRPREEDGPALVAGQKYSLRIDSDWQDARGQSLLATVDKPFTVVPADDEKLDPEQWKIQTPPSGTCDAVVLEFDEPLDQALLTRVLQVRHQDGTVIPGESWVSSKETKWQFAPLKAWEIGTYNIEVATNLEDLCGNSIARPFEVDMQVSATEPTAPAHIAVEFVVK